MRGFLKRVWREARTANEYSEANTKLLTDELQEEVKKAEEEWKHINRNALQWFGAETGAGLLAAGPLISSGHGAFLAAAIATVGATTLKVTIGDRKSYKKKFPAAFFLRV